MICSKCGYNNTPDSKWCVNCGTSLVKEVNVSAGVNDTYYESNGVMNSNPSMINEQTVNNTNFNKGGIRVALKNDAKSCKKNSLVFFAIIGLLVILGINILMNFIVSGTTNFFDLVMYESDDNIFFKIVKLVVDSIVLSFFVFGFTCGSLNILRNKEVSVGDIFKDIFSKVKYLFVVILMFLIYYLYDFGYQFIDSLLLLLVIKIAFLILFLYVVPAMHMLIHMYADDSFQKLKFPEMFKGAFKFVKGHRIEYYGMLFSFVGWFLLSMLGLFIPFICTIPYASLSMASFYRYLSGEKQIVNCKSAIANGLIVILFAIGYLLVYIIIMFMVMKIYIILLRMLSG